MSAEMTEFKVISMPACKVIGKEIRCTMGFPEGNPIPKLWDTCFADGTVKSLEQHPQRLYPNALLGWMGRFNHEENTFSYIVGIAAKPDADVPDEMTGENLPETDFAIATIQGQEPDIYMKAHELLHAEMEAKNLSPNQALGCAMEWYDERFCGDSTIHVIDYYEPVIKG